MERWKEKKGGREGGKEGAFPKPLGFPLPALLPVLWRFNHNPLKSSSHTPAYRRAIQEILSTPSLWGAVLWNKVRIPNTETALDHLLICNRAFYLLLLFAKGKGRSANNFEGGSHVFQLHYPV